MFDLEEVITTWKVKYGEKRTGKKYGSEFYAIPIHERMELLRHLVQSLKNMGKDKEFFKQDRTKNAIAAACFPPVVYDKEARRRGYEVVWRELREVVAEFWPVKEVQDATENIKNDKVTPEPVLHESPFKELDRSVLKNVPITQDTTDPEMDKLLGFIDE